MEQSAAQLLVDIALCIVFSALFSHIVRFLKQPLVLGYVAAGIFLSPVGFRLVQSNTSIQIVSEAGLIFFLFTIGLEINLREMKHLGKSVIAIGLIQVVACTLLGIALFSQIGLGVRKLDWLYVAFGLSMTSTIVVVKLLQDQFEIATIAGKLTIGILLLQDLFAVSFISLQPYLLHPQLGELLRSFGMGAALVVVIFVSSRYFLTPLLRSAAKNSELILLSAVAWCFAVSGLAEYLGLSRATGALLAGVSIASSPYGTEIISQLSGVRDFFVTLFFVSLGLRTPLPTLALFVSSLGLVVFVIFSRIVSVVPTSLFMGKGLRAGIVTALNLSVVDEFALVILVLGLRYGHVAQGLESLVLMSMLLTSIVGTYLIRSNDSIGRWALGLLGQFGFREKVQQVQDHAHEPHDVVLLGCFRTGQALLRLIEKEAPQLKPHLLVVDYNPALESDLKRRGYDWAYADLAHAETLKGLGIEFAQVVICSLSDTFLKGITLERLLTHVRQIAPQAQVICMSEEISQSQRLLSQGVEQVVVPDDLAAREILALLGRKMFSMVPLT